MPVLCQSRQSGLCIPCRKDQDSLEAGTGAVSAALPEGFSLLAGKDQFGERSVVSQGVHLCVGTHD